MKFGKTVKFVVDSEALKEFDVSTDVYQLSELVDKLTDKSNKFFVLDLLSTIHSSMDSR